MACEKPVACASRAKTRTHSYNNRKFLISPTAISDLESENSLVELSNKLASLPFQDITFLRDSTPKFLDKNNSW